MVFRIDAENIESVYAGHITGNGPAAGGTAWVEFSAEDGYPILHYDGGGSGGSSGGDHTASGIPPGAPPFVQEAPVSWSSVQTAGGYFAVTKGAVYYWNGNYYVGTKDQTIEAWNVEHNNPDTFTNWFTLAKYTSTIHDISEYPSDTYTMQPTERGDICKVGDDYYVFSDGGNTSYGPIREPNRWTKIN